MSLSATATQPGPPGGKLPACLDGLQMIAPCAGKPFTVKPASPIGDGSRGIPKQFGRLAAFAPWVVNGTACRR